MEAAGDHEEGRATTPTFANAMMSRSAPGVHLASIDPESLAVRGVRYRAWDQARWDAAETDDTAALPDLGDVVPPPAEPSFTLDVPYPASNFKLLVAVFTLSLVDRGALRLDGEIAFNKKKRPLREWLKDMITWSDDESTQAIVKALHAMKRMEELNPFFARLGLSTLQIHDTSPRNGRNWQPGRIHMTAWDTARLLWLLDPEAPPPSWRVEGAFLRPESRALLMDLLGEQAFHDVLSTTALCGMERTARGIPALYPSRWIGADGRAQVESGAHGGDIRPCNTEAQVTFAHKTGLTLNFGSDAGIVRGIPGRARRHYLIAFFSNLGHRYTDPDKASGPNPCRELGICYTQRIGALGAAIDAALTRVMDPSPAR
jgi:hypothetical protein